MPLGNFPLDFDIVLNWAVKEDEEGEEKERYTRISDENNKANRG